MDYEKVLGERKFPTYEELKNGLLQLIDEGKISREDAARLLPELREGEEEVIRKAIIELLKEVEEDETYTGRQHIPDMLSYLEKQKEQPISAEEVLARAGLKPYKDGNQWCILAGDNIQEGISGFGDTIEDALYEFLKEVLDLQKEQKPAEKQDYSGLNDLERAILRGFLSAGVENVPVTIIKETAKECLAQMKPAGWSEEDERILERAIHIIVEYSDIDEKESEIVQKWLKSLYLQPKQGLILTEEQEKKFGHLFSRPSWKPSEKQMNCLCAAVDAAIRKHNESVSGYEPARILKSLYEDLKKL